MFKIDQSNHFDVYAQHGLNEDMKNDIIHAYSIDHTSMLDAIDDMVDKKKGEIFGIFQDSYILHEFASNFPDLKKEFLITAIQNIELAQMKNRDGNPITGLSKKILLHTDSQSVYHYFEMGNVKSDYTVVQLPGLVAGENMYKDTFSYFDQNGPRVISPRVMHNMWSQHGEITYEDQSKYIYDFMDHSGVLDSAGKVLLLGNSMTGLGVAQFATQYPELKDKFHYVLNSPPYGSDLDLFNKFFSLYMAGSNPLAGKYFRDNSDLLALCMAYFVAKKYHADLSVEVLNLREQILSQVGYTREDGSSKLKIEGFIGNDIVEYLDQNELNNDALKFLNRVFLRGLFYKYKNISPDTLLSFVRKGYDRYMRSGEGFKYFHGMATQTQRNDRDLILKNLNDLGAQVTLLRGNKDPISTVDEGLQYYASHLPQADVVMIDDCGHVPPMEKPGEYVSVINELLKK